MADTPLVKHIFLINPAAGNGRATLLIPQILSAAKQLDVCYEIHRTVNVGDARRYVKEHLENGNGEIFRFYACGGDGTLNEVLNGMVGYDNAQLACVPLGSGNDFIRNFEDPSRFLDISRQIQGISVSVDVIEYAFLGAEDGAEAEETECIGNLPAKGYALNMINIGFDAGVAAMASKVKGRFIKGLGAYISGVGIELVKMKFVKLAVSIDGEAKHRDTFLIAGAANGSYSGSGFRGMPMADTRDGIMDVLLVRAMSRRFFLSIVKKYHDGTHMSDPRLDRILYHHPCKTAEFRSEGKMQIVIDGEPAEVDGLRCSICHAKIQLVLPT
jgi:diacylglycerol kinase family enzyme